MNWKAGWIPFLFCLSCTKTVGLRQQDSGTASQNNTKGCAYVDTSLVNYGSVAKRIFDANCLPCHSTPGDGGINLDTYQGCKDLAQSGELLGVIVYNPDNIQMPPPPQNLMDSCEVKALSLWIQQGCKP